MDLTFQVEEIGGQNGGCDQVCTHGAMLSRKNTFLMQEAIKAARPFSMILKFHYICTEKSIR
jgi:hypothetical protein